MTDRLNGVWVVFDEDIRDDDAEPILEAIRCIRHVAEVTPNVANIDSHIAETRARHELIRKMWEVLKYE